MMPSAPDFKLPRHDGGEFALADRTGVAATVVVFYRGHWCPYCRRYLAKLQRHLPKLISDGAQVVAISPEDTRVSASLAAELGLGFPLLSDTGGGVIGSYGVRNAHVSSLLPHPAVFVIDADGKVRYRSIDRNYKKRTTVRTICGVLQEIRSRPPQA